MTEQGRPVPTVHRIDLSAAHHGVPAVPASPEARLFDAYRHLTSGAPVMAMRRTEPCVCGDDITAEWGWEAAAVDAHNDSPRHAAWRAWREA